MTIYSDFSYNNKVYPLTHLNTQYVQYTQKATLNKPEKQYRCIVEFSTHCFTKNPNVNKGEILEKYDQALYYVTDRETRIFCFDRYRYSLKLPLIVQEMAKQKCFFTSANDKFLRISIEDSNDEKVNYEIYFSLKKSINPDIDIYLFINSAYVRSTDYGAPQNLKRKAISFFTLLNNTLSNKKIRRPL